MLRERIENFIRDTLPEGAFWVSAAAETFVRALARAVEPVASFADGLRDAVNPGTANRDVLLTWWNFVRIECSETPADTEALRAAVLSALGSPPGHTIAGLRALVRGQGLEFVELRHRLPVSWIPSAVPFPVDPHARVLEVWNSPLLHSDERVRCVVRAFAQAADTLRLIEPQSSVAQVGTTAAELAFKWRNIRGDTRLIIERGSEVTTVPLSVRSEVDAFAHVVGIPPECLWNGLLEDPTECSILTPEGVPALISADPSDIFRDRAYSFTGADGEAYVTGDAGIGDVPDDESFAMFMLVRYNTFPSVATVAAGKQDSQNTFDGWNLFLRPDSSNPVWQFRVDPSGGSFSAVNLTAASNTPGDWRALVGVVNRSTGFLSFASDLEAGTPVPFIGFASNDTPLRIGDSRPGSNVGSIDGDVALLAFSKGAAVDSIDPLTAARALRRGYPSARTIERDQGIRWDEALGIPATDDMSGETVTWHLERDFGDGAVPITVKQTQTI